ncbi:MAG: hypothetical protein HPY54_03290 [Chthonomonadetes bacterium]|nr:hypothetical protein [Chthonomonadetes bacterium]
MDRLYVPLLILLTSCFAYLYMRRRSGIRGRDVWQAVAESLEFIGCWVLVYGANLLFGLVAILLIRRLTGFFISVYVFKSLMLTLLTLLQALVIYHLWRRRRG